jgi:hypothetical protein
VPVDPDKLMADKRIVAWAAWFVSDDWKLLRFNSEIHTGDSLPTDGFLCARTRFADGTGENIGGNGWIVFLQTPAGLIFQATGDNNLPDRFRYYGAKLIKDKLAPSAILHVAFEEAAQWR